MKKIRSAIVAVLAVNAVNVYGLENFQSQEEMLLIKKDVIIKAQNEINNARSRRVLDVNLMNLFISQLRDLVNDGGSDAPGVISLITLYISSIVDKLNVLIPNQNGIGIVDYGHTEYSRILGADQQAFRSTLIENIRAVLGGDGPAAPPPRVSDAIQYLAAFGGLLVKNPDNALLYINDISHPSGDPSLFSGRVVGSATAETMLQHCDEITSEWYRSTPNLLN